MAELRSQDKRDKLRMIYQQCTTTTKKPLYDSLMDALKICDDAISDGGSAPGTFLSSSSENGGSVAFQMLSGFTPIVAKRLIGEMLDAYEKAEDWLTTNVTNGTQPSDDQIYDAMMKYQFRSVRKFRSDFTGGRYGVGFYLGTS